MKENPDDPHPAFLEFIKTLDRNELAKIAIDMKRAGDSEVLIRLVLDRIKSS